MSLITVAFCLTHALLAADTPQPTEPAAKIQVTWLGHAAFEVVSPGGTRLLTDPWLAGNPSTPAEWKSPARAARDKPAAILVTHSHGDHASEIPTLAAATGALVVATGEHLRAMKIPEAQQHTMNVGGRTRIGDVEIVAVPAMHSTEHGGRPLGFVLRFASGLRLYHTGDTWLFGDMALIQELHPPDVILLNMGGARFGMDPPAAMLAVKKYFRPKLIIPMHFGTFDPLSDEQSVRAAVGADKRVRFMKPGETLTLP